jgi:glycerol-3-phosphate dehydrogenase
LLQKNEYDVIIVGGGINGVGIARDCALRGIRALLIEKHDFARGASGNNTGMIHGGIRYLRYDVKTTKISCTDSGYIQKIASHLLSRIPFLFPVFQGDSKGRLLLEGAEIFFEAYDVFQSLKQGKSHTRLTGQEALTLEPGLSSDVIGAVTLDEWGINAYRLTVENAIDAVLHGADVRTYCDLNDFVRSKTGAVIGVRFYDRLRHGHEEHRAPVVINATGGWGPRISAKTGVAYRLRQSKGVHLVFSHRISNYGMIMNAVDGRQMFFLPHESGTIIGTTDDDFYGDLDAPPMLEDEVKYILQSARKVFPAIDKYRLISTYVGIRPTIYQWGKIEDKLSREHVIIDHAEDDIPGLFSVTGGKLAAYRQLAEEVTDLLAHRMQIKVPCRTHETLLPGAKGNVDVEAMATQLNISRLSVSRMVSKFGSCAKVILDSATTLPKTLEEVCLCESVSNAEIRYSAKNELVRCLDDLRGRTKIGKGACGGCHCLWRASQIFAEEKNLKASQELVELHSVMNQTFRERRTVLKGANLASEELLQVSYFLSGNLVPFMKAAEYQLGFSGRILTSATTV